MRWQVVIVLGFTGRFYTIYRFYIKNVRAEITIWRGTGFVFARWGNIMGRGMVGSMILRQGMNISAVSLARSAYGASL